LDFGVFRMPRPEMVTIEQKKFITAIKTADPKLTAKDVIGAVWGYLVFEAENDEKRGTLHEEDISLIFEEQVSETGITSYLSGLNKRLRNAKPIDEEWTLTTLLWNQNTGWDFTAEAIPHLLKIKDLCRTKGRRISIRQGLWIAKLYAMPHHEGVEEKQIISDEQKYEHLWWLGFSLASFELAYEQADIPFDFQVFEATSIDGMLERCVEQWVHAGVSLAEKMKKERYKRDE
jgi:hypothetical protein